ncbi:sodium-dependent bicarbonate transport family permease [Neolewinella persica]|uniref:sodium-dependent bicarbonate transport family permease n=1 Tax=Neolewinella persica TaxID=70998 RepID=UPI0003A046EF|nr:sodium-dependent bicarbonate transport family permease [Neolewinella persica]
MSNLLENLTNPALLFFVLGILAVRFKNDLKIPDSSSKFISIYLLLCIGFKGGNELSHNALTNETFGSLGLGFLLASMIPVIAFFILRNKVDISNAGAIAAAYGSVSAVTFVTAISFLEFEGVGFDGYMIAVMALMEAPAIVVGILLIRLFNKREGAERSQPKRAFLEVFNHSVNNASVFLIMGSLVIGYLASDQQAEGIKPFTTDIFKGFLAVFLLDMGLQAGSQLSGMRKNGGFLILFAGLFPFFNGLMALGLASLFTDSSGNLLLFAILGAGASYIAVPAAYKNAVPEANPGIYLPMALGITFPINIIIGIPFYYYLIGHVVMV